MRNYTKNPKLNDLRNTIKEYASEIKELRIQASKTSGPERHALKQEARYIGSHHARHHLLAYGLLRGKTRDQMEPSTTRNKVNETYLRKLLELYAAPAETEKKEVA
jgi:hypothetical protein